MEEIFLGYEEAMVSNFFYVLQYVHLSVENDMWV